MVDLVDKKYILRKLDVIKTETDLNNLKDELNSFPPKGGDAPCVIPEQDDFDIYGAIDEVKRSYIRRALDQTENYAEASKLLGLKNYQTLMNWIKRLAK